MVASASASVRKMIHHRFVASFYKTWGTGSWVKNGALCVGMTSFILIAREMHVNNNKDSGTLLDN
jgi:hypothetical protein